MNSMIKRISKDSLLQGILAAILVFVGGFGVMYLMYHHWLQTDSMNYPKLKGLFDYKASLYGDSICFPVIVGSGTAYCSFFKRKNELSRKERNLPLIIGCVGGLIGVVIQAKWVISDNTVCNWSIPTKHHFNYAGWYHAVFLFLYSLSFLLYLHLCY